LAPVHFLCVTVANPRSPHNGRQRSSQNQLRQTQTPTPSPTWHPSIAFSMISDHTGASQASPPPCVLELLQLLLELSQYSKYDLHLDTSKNSPSHPLLHLKSYSSALVIYQQGFNHRSVHLSHEINQNFFTNSFKLDEFRTT
jgi:hypothetical protein